MPIKWLQERANGSKNDTGMPHEGPSVGGRFQRISDHPLKSSTTVDEEVCSQPRRPRARHICPRVLVCAPRTRLRPPAFRHFRPPQLAPRRYNTKPGPRFTSKATTRVHVLAHPPGKAPNRPCLPPPRRVRSSEACTSCDCLVAVRRDGHACLVSDVAVNKRRIRPGPRKTLSPPPPRSRKAALNGCA